MQPIICAALLLLSLPPQNARAESEESSWPQAETRQVSTGERFWASFLDLLAGRPGREGDLQVRVLDAAGRPLAGVRVMVGAKAGAPFAGNVALTGADGTVAFSDESLRGGAALPLTAWAEGYTTFTLLNNADNRVELRLQRHAGERDFSFLRGKVTGFPPGYGGGVLEMGFFLPAFRPESLLNFDPQQFVSSFQVKIDVYGEREVPGNLVLPPQRKRWGLIPISVSKPDYVMPLPRGMSAHMLGLVGAIPISEAMSAIQNKDFLAALNLATLTHVGWTSRRVEVRGDESFDIAAGNELAKGALNARLAAVPEKLDAVAVSLVDPKGDRGDYLPMDVKALKAEEIRNGQGAIALASLKDRRPQDGIYVFAGLFDRAQLQNSPARAIAGSLRKLGENRANVGFAGFFRHIRALGVGQGNRDFRFTSAANPRQNLAPTLLLLNVVSERKNALTQGVTRRVLWTTVVRGDAERVLLPDLGRPVLPPADPASEEKFHWEVVALRSRPERTGLDLQGELRNLQHVSSLQQKF